MSMMYTPTLAPGARTLPINLRDHRAGSHGAYRLHGNMAPVTEHPLNPMAGGMAGLGEFCDDSGICYPDVTGGTYLDPTTIQSTIDQLPVGPSGVYTGPIIVSTADPSGNITSQSMTPAQITALINAGSTSLQRVLAITQGGSVLANGSIIGSQQAAQLAAAQSGLNISTAGLSGLFSNPVVLLGGLALVVVLMSRK